MPSPVASTATVLVFNMTLSKRPAFFFSHTFKGQPYNMPSAKYEAWKDVDVGFRLADMFGG